MGAAGVAAGCKTDTMSYRLLQADSFWDCVDSLRRDDRYASALVDTLAELRRQPFRNPKLRTHEVEAAGNRRKLYASDVGGRRSDRRVVWQVFDRTLVVLLYGTHKIYERAARMRIGLDSGGQVVLYEAVGDSGTEHPYQTLRDLTGKLFMAWKDEELLSFGLPDATVEHLRRLNTDDELLELETQLGPHFELAFNLVANIGPDGASGEPDEQSIDDITATRQASTHVEPVDAAPREGARSVTEPSDARMPGPVAPEVTEPSDAAPSAPEPPEVTEDDRRIDAALNDDSAPSRFTRLEPEFLRSVLGKPIEDWMIFLHPEQRAAIGRSYQGPARVRGAAGTGKTVIGLHRAAHLAARNRALMQKRRAQFAGIEGQSPTMPVLFTTYISSLPPVLESLYRRLPGTVAGEVEFINIDKLARRICRDFGDSVVVRPPEIDRAYTSAYETVVRPGTPLGESKFSKGYLRDEVTQVIKGRALGSIDEYLTLERTGRRAPMGRQQRSQVWELMSEWDALMAEGGYMDFCDVINRALTHARGLESPMYSSVIVDEAQDLTAAGLQLLRAIVNAPEHHLDKPDGLLILGDAAQRIYPGGFKLRQAGVEVRGRTTVLASNYRNTAEIIDTALEVAGDCRIDDLDEEFRRDEQSASAVRRGPRPRLVEAVGLDAQLDEVVRLIEELVGSEAGYGVGDIAVLMPTNAGVGAVVKRLSRRHLPTQKLDQYDGAPSPRVKVGTYFRSKGLEFKVVFLPQVSRNVFPRTAKWHLSDDESAESRDLQISQLFVAMTRARDQLVVLHDGDPSDVVAAASDRFERSTPPR